MEEVRVERVEFQYNNLHKRIDNKSVQYPQRDALVVNTLLIMPMLLVWDREEDDLALLILAPHQKHIGEGTKCCYYQKQTFEFKLHLYLIHSLTPRSNALPESLKHLVRESFVTARNNFTWIRERNCFPACFMIALQFLFSFSEATIETIQKLYVLQTWFFSYVWLNSVNCLHTPSGHSAAVSLKLVSKLSADWINSCTYFPLFSQYVEAYTFRSSAICFLMAKSLSDVIPLKDILMDHQMQSAWQTIFTALLNARPLQIKNNNNICKWPLLRATWYSMTVKGEQIKQSRGTDHCPTATSMSKAVRATHCGIGIVSEVIKWGVEGFRYVLSPDALTASCPAKNQTSGSVFPASPAVIESEQERQLGIRSTPLLVEAEQRSASEQEAATIYISSPTTVQNKGNLLICRINDGRATHGSTVLDTKMTQHC